MTNTPWLSILLPSINISDREKFLQSLEHYAYLSRDGVEILIDNEPGGVMPALDRLVRRAQSEWSWIVNDNLVCESYGWDTKIKHMIDMFPDLIAMFYPNDCLFEETFACFPITSTKLLQKILPVPYQKYKIDDEIMDIIPKDRQFYLPDVIMRHDVGNPLIGFKTANGKVYPVDEKIGYIDHMRYLSRAKYRKILREDLLCQMTMCW